VHAGQRVSRKIKELIKQHKTTAEQVAFIADISKSYLSAILRCKKSPTIRTLEKIARALDVDVKDLF
jgi:transcriptional regulator with XRE-family HTH domain